MAAHGPLRSPRERVMFTGLIMIAVLVFCGLYLGRRLRRRL